MRENLATLLDDFRRYGAEIAVVRFQGNRRRVTRYGEIASLASRFATYLAQRGIAKGDRVLLWAENSAEWIAAFYGCLLRGVLAVPLDAGGTVEFAGRVAVDVNAGLAVGDALLIDQLPIGIPRMKFEDWPTLLPKEQAAAIAGLDRDTPLQILFTSGTTGDPKGIVLTHGNVLASFEPIEKASQPYLRYERLIHPLRILHTLPLSHVFGQTMGLWVPSIFRAELHLENRLVAARIMETIRRERISVLAAVPRVYALLRNSLESTLPGLAERVAAVRRMKKRVNPWYKWWVFRDVHGALGLKFWALISGGGALPADLEAFWNAVGLVVVQGYGMTETTALITLNHPFRVAQGTIGKPLAGREVKLGPDGEVLVRGAAISQATWSGGALHPRTSEWLATGDLAQTEPTGELRFVGRKSEVIVTAAGVNVHPEDLEAAIEQEPGVTACAVVPVETEYGPEPMAVLALRGQDRHAAMIIEHANAHLAEYQRLRRWVIWPEPDLPRTSTGKVRRNAVVAGIAQLQSAAVGNMPSRNGTHHGNGHGLIGKDARGEANGAIRPPSDWLLQLIARISGEAFEEDGDELLLTEDLHLDSLGRVQLASAIEERAGIAAESVRWDRVHTLGDLRRLVGSGVQNSAGSSPNEQATPGLTLDRDRTQEQESQQREIVSQPPRTEYLYPHWPWWSVFRWLRAAFVEVAMRPLVRLLSTPTVVGSGLVAGNESMLIVANHVTSYDVPLLQYALAPAVRRHMAVMMSGEMLDDYRHFRNADRRSMKAGFFLPGPLFYLLLTSFFNVFPLPKQRDFQKSFAHAGDALDKGMNVLVFPEGKRSGDGRLASFRPGIGLLVKQSFAPVLPMAIRGLGELKTGGRRWFRSRAIEVRVGLPMRFPSTESEASITAQLQAAVEDLLTL